ncbi:Acetyl-coenzyme A synthetase [Fasciola hepatica]|uniref:Acetyl-coenzyme A synthetase n=1 Tax=Fasciola hepatica TaxID=6192 RepID=A0A4E0R5Q1_FASHE|nr:Acetyl-coenzyme A synthetase [Fasciola hepatica]
MFSMVHTQQQKFYKVGVESGIVKATVGKKQNAVQKLGLALRSLGVTKGDRVAIYMPMVPQLVVAMLACARIGAVHSVVFGGFSAPALADRIIDSDCKVLITCDGTWRGAKLIDLYSNASTALQLSQDRGHVVSKCVVLRHVTIPPHGSNVLEERLDSIEQIGIRPAKQLSVRIAEGRDIWWHDLVAPFSDDCQCPIEWMNAEDPLFVLYTSGSTGRPKGILHTIGGYMVYSATTFYHTFNYQDDDIYWCTADAGWITGHSYVVYGPLLNGATSVIFEGIPTWPDMGRCWAIVDRYQVSKFYTAPTAIRTLMAAGDSFVTAYKRNSLKVLGSVGEPINPTAWEWYHHVVGNGNCSVVDTFWQTETGGHMVSPLPGVTPLKPGCATRPFLGIDAQILSDKGANLSAGVMGSGKSVEGYLVFGKPWPGMMRTVYGDHKRFESVYFSRFPGYYMAGDGAKMDEDGDIWITGRIDDMLNISGHLVSTAEVESTLLLHPHIAEAAVVSRMHPVKGECLHCFVTLKNNVDQNANGAVNHVPVLDATLRSELCQLIRKRIGPFVVPDHIQEARMLPKTRSGKVLRRLLRKIANQDFDFGDTSTLADQSCLDELVKMALDA